jgi:hypothetical protein
MKLTKERLEEIAAPAERPDWFKVGEKVFLVLAFIPIVLMISAAGEESPEAVLTAAERVPICGWTAVGLACVSGIFAGLRRWKLGKGSPGAGSGS